MVDQHQELSSIPRFPTPKHTMAVRLLAVSLLLWHADSALWLMAGNVRIFSWSHSYNIAM